MAIWEYKVISSGRGGFATPALLEKFLNDVGKDQWEIIDFRTAPDNPLAFTGLARRPTQRDWTLEDAAAAAAKAEADKVRAEFEAKFKGIASAAPAGAAGESETAKAIDEKVSPDDGFRRPIDTSRDQDPDAEDEESAPEDDWDKLVEEDELPTFFEAIRPHMRRNQRGPGTSVGVDYLAKKWGFAEDDVIGALKECGFDVPEDENAKPVYLEYDGDLYWVNVNRRGELWINTKEKPRPVFRVVQGQRASVEEEEPAAKGGEAKAARSQPAPERKEKSAPPADAPAEALATGPELLEKIRPKMRRNRHDAGGSGSVGYLSRAFKCNEADLLAAFGGLGLAAPGKAGEKPAPIEIGAEEWWLNQDQRGGVWINVREKKSGDATPEADAPSADAAGRAADAPKLSADAGAQLAGVRLLLKPTRTGGVAAELTKLAAELAKSPEDLTAALTAAGLKVPEKPREKPVFVEHAGEIFWFNLNAKGELWVNAKASKFADKEGEGGKAKRSRPRRKKDDGAPAAPEGPAAEAPAPESGETAG